MIIRYQWAQKNPTGWQEVDAGQWKDLPKRPIPSERGGNDNAPGWLRNVNVQGLTTEGFDHIAIEPIVIGNDEGVKLTVWNDDPEDYPVGERQAAVWTILPLAPDPELGMAINTRQSCVLYCEGARRDRLLEKTPHHVSVRPWTEFVPPPDELARHGVWLEDEKHAEHVAAAPHHQWGWHHWADHLPDSETAISPDGRRVLKEQRAQGRYRQSAHTITYFQRDTNRAVGFAAATNEDALETTTATSATETVTTNAATVAGWQFTAPEGAPGVADWPNGDYHTQININSISASMTIAMDGRATGSNFSRVATGFASTLETAFDGANFYSTTGLHLFAVTWDPTAGATTDVYGVGIGCTGNSHGAAITLTLNTTDSYADGPWSTAAARLPAPVLVTNQSMVRSNFY